MHISKLRTLLFFNIFLFAFVYNIAHAAKVFHKDDFVVIPELSEFKNLEVQKSEVTFGQWSSLKNLLPAPHQTPWESNFCDKKYFTTGTNLPVTCITQDDIDAFMSVLNSEDPEYYYRLPNSSELNTLVSMTLGGLKSTNAPLESKAWLKSNSGLHAHDVCTTGEVFGLCDVVGNVWEWSKSNDNDIDFIAFGGGFANPVEPWRFFNKGEGLLRDDLDEALGFRLIRFAK